MSTKTEQVISHRSSSSCFKKDSCVHSKWFGVALLVGSVVIGGLFSTGGGIGLFSPINSLPDWLVSAIGTIGSNGCWGMFLWGCFLGIAGGISGIVLIVKAHVREKVNCRDASGLTPLHHAIRNQDEKEIERLIDQGADVNMETKEGFPLLTALSFESSKTALSLLTAPDLDLEKTDSKGRTALFSDKPEIVRFLLTRGVNVNIQDQCGCTPLHLANSNSQILSMLLNDPNINVNIQDNNGDTPLHYIARLSPQNIQMLIRHRADPNIQNHQHQTTFDVITEAI